MERVGGVDDEDPVAMAEEGHGFGDAGFPVGLGGQERWGSEDYDGDESKTESAFSEQNAGPLIQSNEPQALANSPAALVKIPFLSL